MVPFLFKIFGYPTLSHKQIFSPNTHQKCWVIFIKDIKIVSSFRWTYSKWLIVVFRIRVNNGSYHNWFVKRIHSGHCIFNTIKDEKDIWCLTHQFGFLVVIQNFHRIQPWSMLKIVETFTVKLIDLCLSGDCQDEHCDGGDDVFHSLSSFLIQIYNHFLIYTTIYKKCTKYFYKRVRKKMPSKR